MTTSNPPDLQRQLQRKIDGHLQSESSWLQKVLFALGKAREARDKLAATGGDPLPPLFESEDGTHVPIEFLEASLKHRIGVVMESLGQGVHRLPR
jgi:hypothetical protein